MKLKTIISLLCSAAVTLCSSGFSGIMALAADDTAMSVSVSNLDVEDEEFPLLDSSSEYLTVEEVAEKAMPSVVTVTNSSTSNIKDWYGIYGFGFGFGYDDDEFGYEMESVSVGSGIIVGENDSELLILTNNHMVEGAKAITIGFIDDTECSGDVKGTDASLDVAVVAVPLLDIPDDTMSQIKIAEIGNSDSLSLGQQVVAIGNALGYGQSVTTGIVSALNRTVDIEGYTAQMIQTDAAINGGNSGGPLLDMKGHVIGINAAKAEATGVEGMGYAIPISDVTDIVEELMNKKTRTEVVDESRSAYIGITGQDVSQEMSSLYGIPEGIYIMEVEEGSPAEKAGLKARYIITRFDSSSVSSMSELSSRLQYYEAGEVVPITVMYQDNGEYVEATVELTLGSMPDQETSENRVSLKM